jgi:NAD(P)-dependent dehydrogenase (short-subunit alcohol dehydrogenase family)
MRSVLGEHFSSRPCDVAIWEEVIRVFDQLGQVDVLVNSAGIAGRTSVRSDQTDPADVERVFQVNFFGSYHTSKAVIPGMVQRGYGRILHIASIAGKEGNAGMLAYSASKAAVIGMTKVQGKELACTGVTVNALAPAVIQTPMVDALPAEQIKYMTDKIPARRCGSLEELVAMVEFIVTSRAGGQLTKSLLTMKPITWLRKFGNRGNLGYPVATLAFYGPNDRKASKAVLGIKRDKQAEIELHKWFRSSPQADLRYDVKLQNTWIEIIRREGVKSLAMLEEINGCPHEEGIDYPMGEECPECPFWALRTRPIDQQGQSEVITGVAWYKPEQWPELLASAEDRDKLNASWEEWHTQAEELVQKMKSEGLFPVRVLLDIDEIKEYCEEHGVPNNGEARSQLALLKTQAGDC